MNYRLIILVLGTFIIGTDDFVIAGLLPNIANDMNIPIATAGQLVTAFAIAYAIGAPILGTLTLNLPLKKLLVLSMFIFAISNGLSAMMPSFEWLFVTRIIAAFAAALFTPLAMTASTRLVPDTMRGKAISFVVSGITIGLILGAPIGTWIGNTLTWRYSFIFIAIVSFITTIGVLFFLPPIEREITKSLKERFNSFNKPILQTLCVSIIATTGGFMTYTYIAPIIQTITGIENISIFLLLFGVGAFLGNLLGGYFTDRIGAPKTLKISFIGFGILLASFSLLMLMSPSTATIVLTSTLALFWGIPGFGLNPALNTYLISLNPKQASMFLSFSASALYVGIGLGAITGGLIIRLSSIYYIGFISGSLLIIAYLIFSITVRRSQAEK